ncbi:MAG: hypothetical protein C4522_03300 [Desulfobacteraceae bacterium]|nr:MAG: hypothetical protein C4522_03300 [Desulfobacteraceae bacterium]
MAHPPIAIHNQKDKKKVKCLFIITITIVTISSCYTMHAHYKSPAVIHNINIPIIQVNIGIMTRPNRDIVGFTAG